MKNKDIYSALTGGAFFAIPYLALSMPVLPSLIIGIAAFGAGELVLSKNNVVKGYTKSLSETLDDARKINKNIQKNSGNIEDSDIRYDLKEINATVNKIITTIEKNPEKARNLENFFEYYLPMTEKIVNKYDDIENQKLSSKDSLKFTKSAKKMLKEANMAFKKLLSKLYESDIIDADADMKVFNTMLDSDGISSEKIEVEDSNE